MTIIRRHFVYHEDEDSGIDGWASMFVPKSAGFTPNRGRGLVHDALEHGLNEDGSFAFEVVAFGRILAMRRGLGINPRALGSELYDTWMHDAESAHFEAPRVGRCAASEDIQEVVAGFARAWVRDSEEGSSKPDKHYCTALANLLQIGYRDAIRRFGGISRCTNAGYAGDSFSRSFNRWGELGDVLVLDYDVEKAKFSYRVIDERNEQGHLSARWAQERVWVWHDHRSVL